jgi:hypothetical protein
MLGCNAAGATLRHRPPGSTGYSSMSLMKKFLVPPPLQPGVEGGPKSAAPSRRKRAVV